MLPAIKGISILLEMIAIWMLELHVGFCGGGTFQCAVGSLSLVSVPWEDESSLSVLAFSYIWRAHPGPLLGWVLSSAQLHVAQEHLTN